MPPAPSGRTKKSDKPAAKKPNGGKLLDSVLTEVKKLYKGRTVEYRPGALNGKGERLLRVDGDTVAYVSILENGNIRALRSKYNLKVTDADPKKVAQGIAAKVKAGPQNSTRTASSGKKSGAGKSGASGTTRQRQASARKQAKTSGATSTPRAAIKPGGATSSEPKKPNGNGEQPKRNGNGPKTPNGAPSGK